MEIIIVMVVLLLMIGISGVAQDEEKMRKVGTIVYSSEYGKGKVVKVLEENNSYVEVLFSGTTEERVMRVTELKLIKAESGRR